MTNAGVGPIPSSSIEKYATGLDSDDRIGFRHIMRRMDAALMNYLEREARKRDRRSPSG